MVKRVDLTLGEVAAICGAKISPKACEQKIQGISSDADDADENFLTCARTPKEIGDVYLSKASACFVTKKLARSLPKSVVALIVEEPLEAIKILYEKLTPQEKASSIVH